MIKRPLIPVALLYVAGLMLAGLPAPLVALFSVSFGLILLFVVWPRARLFALGALIVLAGWVNLAQCRAIISPHDLRTLLGNEAHNATVRGVLRDTPTHRVRRDLRTLVNLWSSIAEVEVREIRIGNEDWRPAYGRIATTTRGILPDSIFAGQTVEVSGALKPAPGPVAEGLFDYRNYLSQRGIYYQMPVGAESDWRIVSSPRSPPLADRFCTWGRKTLARGLPVEDQTLQLEWALTLGWKTAMTDEVSEPFIRAATYHIFAVDGLRIAIISGILLGLLRALGVPRAICGMVAIPFILFYAVMTDWPASAVRAIVMAAVIFCGWALKRPSDLLNSLFAAGIIILVWEPRQLFQAGFQLSFFVVLCIILILPFFNQIGARVLKPDPLLPESLQPRWKKWARRPTHYVLDLFLTSMAAWLGSIPLVAYYFHLITPMSGPANVFAVPLCGLVLVCNLASLLFGAWLPFVTELFNHAGWFCMECIRVTSQWSAGWPAAYYYLPTPGLFTIGLYYLILLTLLTGWLFQPKLRALKIGGLVILCAAWCGQWLWELPVTQLTILPLGGGHAVYVQSPGRHNDWLVDCGNPNSADSTVKSFLRAQGVNRLSNLVLTHGEAAYTGGAGIIRDLFQPRKIYASGIKFRSPIYNDFMQDIKKDPALMPPVQCGEKLGPFTALYPGPRDLFSKGEDNALVLRAEFHGLRVLLMSDLGHAAQNALLDRTNLDLRADIVVAGVPGDGEPLSDALLDAVRPRVIVIADSDYPAGRRASAELKERLAQRKIPVLFCRDCEAVTLTVRLGRWQLRAMDGTQISESLKN